MDYKTSEQGKIDVFYNLCMTCGLINSALTFLFWPLLGAANANACLKGTIGGV
jgi:hypothetical protein